jgi:CRP/FNR family transcriptional regulator, cyclic AMP receptor protein
VNTIAGPREPATAPGRPDTAAGKGAVRQAASSDVTVCSLAAHGFLRGMPGELLAELVPAASLVQLPAGCRLFEDGGHAAHFWLIRSGSVALDLHIPGHGWIIIETLGLGEVVGWSWLFPPYEWAFGAVTVQPTEAFQFGAPAVRKLCDANPALGYQLTRRFLAVVAHRLQASRMRLIDRCVRAPSEVWP